MLDSRLLHAINKGRCFILVGAGPSCEVGYPSWEKLATKVYENLLNNSLIKDPKPYLHYLGLKNYPEFFRQAEVELGARSKLLDLVKQELVCDNRHDGVIYEVIAKWPFACYLTTNFDDELSGFLKKTGIFYALLRNRKEDFYSTAREGAINCIQKLHSDLNHENEAVLTSEDYKKLYIDDSGQYYRDKLRQIFEWVNVLIIGYSLKDPDIDQVLQLARKTASPEHPIFMISADFSKLDEREFYEKYNIVLIPYENKDGHHAQLKRILTVADMFIVPRNRVGGKIEQRPAEEIQLAMSLYVFRRLQSAKSLESINLLILSSAEKRQGEYLTVEQLVSLSPLNTIGGRPDLIQAVRENLIQLDAAGFIDQRNDSFQITERGIEQVRASTSIRDRERDHAFGQFIIDLRRNYDGLTSAQEQRSCRLAESVIVSIFSSRGLAIANKVFSGQTSTADELSDIFKVISNAASELDNFDLKAAFTEAMHNFVIYPNGPQKAYLTSISQGYFLFHLLGLDPLCSKFRRQIFEQTFWFCDSSVLLPLIAKGSHNHEYAQEMFRMLIKAKAVLFTTAKLLQEAWEHFEWAVKFIRRTSAESPEFIRAASLKGSYKQNLFLDGYIRLSAEGVIGNFKDYLEMTFPDVAQITPKIFEEELKKQGIRILDVSELDGFKMEDWGEIEEAKHRIKQEREIKGTFRSELQIESEAEIWIILKNLRSGDYTVPKLDATIEKVYFLSLSRILDRVFQSESMVTWSPEAVYRYMSSLASEQTNPDLLQECMLHEYYNAGISFIDREKYLRFFGPSIDIAKASFDREKKKYIETVEQVNIQTLEEAFNKTPDLEKPFFVAQMGWKVAEAAEKAKQVSSDREVDLREKVKQLESQRDKAWKVKYEKQKEDEKRRLKNLQDPNHLRKRLRQAKKRQKKKK